MQGGGTQAIRKMETTKDLTKHVKTRTTAKYRKNIERLRSHPM